MSVAWAILSSRLAVPVASGLALVLAVALALAVSGRSDATSRAARMGAERDAWKAAADRWRSATRASEEFRRRESETARSAAAESSRVCAVRVDSARRSARAIQTIIQEEVPHDANGCPARGLVPVERLRDALAPTR